MKPNFIPGQRWISEAEPELGIGIILSVDLRFVAIHFPAGEVVRKYAIAQAPVRRVAFQPGDRVNAREGEVFTIIEVSEKEGLLTYRGRDHTLHETELSDTTSFSTPKQRLFGGQVDPSRLFDLRLETLKHQERCFKSTVRGFMGGRVSLIDHQFYIAGEVSTRHIQRVLLSDEVGLGKTIEACLILHRLLVSHRISRVLILVPDPLVHQWFVELLRRFNLGFRIFNRAFSESVRASDPSANPFFEDQLFIAGVDLLAENSLEREMALEGEWEMVVVDEAHHLAENTPSYRLVSELGQRSPGLILVTATPEHLGRREHFGRLRLLDPNRYHDYDAYIAEAENYRRIAAIGESLMEKGELSRENTATLAHLFRQRPEQVEEDLHSSGSRGFLSMLLDRYGPGRVMFRNTRTVIKGFPRRIAHLAPISQNRDKASVQTGEQNALDPRIKWLAGLIRELSSEKILLICRDRETAKAISSGLSGIINVKSALFHGGMSLIQQDRNAAWFSRPDGANLLICSEIGGEGRNFQFSHHLVLFDLPTDPELLEQRIGRLDRIGQKESIHIHVPYLSGSFDEILALWYHRGLNLFEKNNPGAQYVAETLAGKLKALMDSAAGRTENTGAELSLLIDETVVLSAEITEKLRKGRDRLLEMNSFRQETAEGLTGEVDLLDRDTTLENYLGRVFDHLGIDMEETAHRSFHIRPTRYFSGPLPGFREKGMAITFDRRTALAREELEFVTWDHPLTRGVMDFILTNEKGNSACGVWYDPDSSEILLEAVFILESTAPPALHMDRFLPPTPIRVVVDHSLKEVGHIYPPALLLEKLEKSDGKPLLENPDFREGLLPEMVETCFKAAQCSGESEQRRGLCAVEKKLGPEIRRLKSLREVNDHIPPREIELAETEMEQLRKHISSAQPRLDALRLIRKGPQAY